MRRAFHLAMPVVLLAGCAGPLDSEQLRMCRRVLPVLHPEGTVIRETAAARAALGKTGIRIGYTAGEAGAAPRPHHLTCGFGGGVFDPDRLQVVAVEADGARLSEARLLYLQRFWLDNPAAAAETPQRPVTGVPRISASAAYAAQQLVNGVALGAIYALLATAYSLIYGLVGRINLAFGQIAVIGAFAATVALAVGIAFGLADPIVALALTLIVGALLTALWSWAVGMTVVAPLHARHRLGQPILVATIAVAITLDELLRLSQGARERWMPPLLNEPIALAVSGSFVVTLTLMQIAIALLALAAAGGVLMLLAYSRFGRNWRAFADDPQAAALLGVSAVRLLTATFLLAGLLAGLAGWIVAVYYGTVGFAMGTMLGLKALVAAVVGGIGSVPGAFFGGLLVGLLEALWSAYFDLATRDIVVYAILIVVFVLRPGGLLGFSGPNPRQV